MLFRMPSLTPTPNLYQIGVIRNGLTRCVAEETGQKVEVTDDYTARVIVEAFHRIINPSEKVRPVIGAYIREGRSLKLESAQEHENSIRSLNRRAI